MSESTGLANFDRARQALAEARSVDEVKQVRDQAEAMRLYLKQQNASAEMQNQVAAIKLRAERRLGEMLAETEKNKGGRPTETGNTVLPVSVKLVDLDISKIQSSRWQQEAAVPEDVFEAHVAEVTAKPAGELTSAGLLRLAKDRARIQADDDAPVSPLPSSIDIRPCDFRESLAESEYGSIDVIITDPPYPRDSIGLYADLSEWSARALRPGGSLIVMAGQSYFPQVLASLTSHMRYQWMLAYLTPGGQSVQLWDRKVNTFWKPLVWLVNGDYSGPWIGDVAKSQPNDNDKRFHHWGQSESGMADIVERFSRPGDLVCDPFLGGGTTGMVSLALGRRFLGMEIDADQAGRAITRIGREVARG